MADEPAGGTPPRSALSLAWETARGKILVIGASVTIIVGLANIYIDRKELSVVVGIGLTVVAFVGLQFFSDWLSLTINAQIDARLPDQPKTLGAGTDTNPTDEHERAYTSYVRVFGLAYEELVVQCTMMKDGAVTVMRTSKLVAHSGGIGTVDQYLLSDAREGEIKVGPVTSPSRFRTLKSEVKKANSESLTLVVHISPPLAEGESIDLFFPEETPPGSMARTYQEMLDRKKKDLYECVYWDITRPTKHFQLKVLIPRPLSPENAEPDVWFGASRIRCEKEFSRIEGRLTRGADGTLFEALTLDMLYPIPGLRYVVKWIPCKTNQPEGG